MKFCYWRSPRKLFGISVIAAAKTRDSLVVNEIGSIAGRRSRRFRRSGKFEMRRFPAEITAVCSIHAAKIGAPPTQEEAKCELFKIAPR